MAGLVKAAKASGASILIIQEMGETEAREFFAAMGGDWGYDRDGLNVVGWLRKLEWAYEKSVPVNLSSYGQMQRTLLSVVLKNKLGKRVRFSSSHLAVQASDMTAEVAVVARKKQMEEIVAALETEKIPTVLGADWNTHVQYRTPFVNGWAFDKTDLSKDAKKGIDGTAVNYGATIKSSVIVDLAGYSDHDGRKLVVTIL